MARVSAPDAGLNAERERGPEVLRVKTEDANFVMLVLNASQSSPRKNIQVRIDGQLAVDELFVSETADSRSDGPPAFKSFSFRLSSGPHTLVATTAEGDEALRASFELAAGKRWALLGFDYGSGSDPRPRPERFQFIVRDTPIFFE